MFIKCFTLSYCMEKIKKKKLSMNSDSKSIGFSDEFKDYLKHVSVVDDDMYNIEYLLDFFSSPHDSSVASNSFVIYGQPGVGKTFFSERILFEIDKEILYVASKKISHPKAVQCVSVDDIISKMDSSKDQVVFLDGVSSLYPPNYKGNYKIDVSLKVMKLLELLKQHSNKILIMTLGSLHSIENMLLDRIEVIVHIDIPDQYHKRQYLKTNYSRYLTEDLIDYIAMNSIGYNYRDLPSVIKLGYRMGNHSITKKSIKEALNVYHPTELNDFQVENCVLETLNDVIGKKKQLKIVKRLVTHHKNQSLCEEMGLIRNNILLFHGPPGTGKSFMTRALAGEIQFPLIHVDTSQFFKRDPFYAINRIINMANRYNRCVIFFDEAEKMLGNNQFGEDNPILGELHRCLDGGDGGNIQSVLVFAINDLSRFGNTLLDRFTLIEFKLPSFEERCDYFKKKIQKVSTHTDILLKDRDLAFKSEKMSFREIDRFWNDLMYTQLEGGKNSMEEACLNRRNKNTNEVMYG